MTCDPSNIRLLDRFREEDFKSEPYVLTMFDGQKTMYVFHRDATNEEAFEYLTSETTAWLMPEVEGSSVGACPAAVFSPISDLEVVDLS